MARWSVGSSLVVTLVSAPVGWPPARADGQYPRWFADRPVAWDEHDDQDVPRPPGSTRLQEWDTTLLLRDSLANEIDRVLALEAHTPAEDVNALDEVPCSTWFCIRNHLHPMTAEEVAAGPSADPPRLPLTIVKGKDQGAAAGFQVVDASGRKFLLKLDPAGHLGLATGAEAISHRIFHAAGYNVPGAFVVDLVPQRDLRIAPDATFRLHGVKKRPLTATRVQSLLAGAARTDDGKVRAAAVPWIQGTLLGGFDMIGRRADDPNDRIPHQHRRSLRASWLLFAWISSLDPGSINTLDSYVEQDGRGFVRHYFIDFGATLGSATTHVKGPDQAGEHLIEVGRTLRAFVSMGFYRRPFQHQRARWEQLEAQHPSVGWFPAEGFDPGAYRSNRKIPAHMRRTNRDLYWGAKVVTSFSDQQLAAIVNAARLPDRESSYVVHALRVRRDIIGRRYLATMTAIEDPAVAPDGSRLCFRDLAIERGFARSSALRYDLEISDGYGKVMAAPTVLGSQAHTCVPLGQAGAAAGTGYLIVRAVARMNGPGATTTTEAARAARIHLRWRESERRFVAVGLERDE